MSVPKRIQMSRQRPWRAENPDAVIVARPSKYGNPFRISSTKETRKAPRWWHVTGWRSTITYLPSLAAARREATEEFADWIARPALNPYDWHQDWIRWHTEIRRSLDAGELAGRDVVCWCPLDHSCHGDVYLELANGGGR